MENYNHENLSAIVIKYLKRKILIGEFKEGDHIPEANVAEELGISRAPVREGIRELQNQGLVQFVPRKGNFVAKFNMEDVKEIFDIRIQLENSVLEILIKEKLLSAKDIEKLYGIIDEMVAIANEDGNNPTKIVRLNEKDMEFHIFLWRKSNSKRRIKILTDLFFQLQMAMVIDTKLTGNLDVTAKEHNDIMKYLVLGDLENCKQALKNHIITYSITK
ncbi:MAG: GntR family transcriptional regulator [Desulfitobacteriaceae bacterium]